MEKIITAFSEFLFINVVKTTFLSHKNVIESVFFLMGKFLPESALKLF